MASDAVPEDKQRTSSGYGCGDYVMGVLRSHEAVVFVFFAMVVLAVSQLFLFPWGK